ncbi:hypothetical protein NM208_g3642 [Fusarium decemcellulare]|uniref:Uncharacterized protein n=1 Tax=Fusarium decemcellulare TaxID=57161 RepID=A0ACC1SNM2_9HYPO|nr:hypothetical protein NM208_g3642 [Fusarium decemcellulare]
MGERIESAEENLKSPDTIPPLILVQSLLLMNKAASYGSVRRSQFKRKEWLDLAILKLPHALRDLCLFTGAVQRCQREDEVLSRRLWWSCFLAEQAHALRCLENRSTRPTSFSLDPRMADSISISDLRLGLQELPSSLISDHWAQLERAECYIERTKLARLTFELLATDREQSDTEGLVSRTIINKDELWKLQEIVEQYKRYQRRAERTFLEAAGDAVLSCLRLGVDLLFHRTIIAHCQSLSRRTPETSEGYLRQRILQTRISESVLCIVAVAEEATKPWNLAVTDCRVIVNLLRSLTVAAQSVIKPPRARVVGEMMTIDQSELTKAFKRILTQCLEEHDTFWIKPFLSDTPYSSDEYAINSTLSATPSSMSDEASTPSYEEDDYLSSQEVCGAEETHLFEQHSLMSSFDDMWNKGRDSETAYG